mmetsp:Transcript_74742/g.173106  ORF Transcript_74742/g.173106 Transcript_74742/m.173106 type:complete len:251 (+) Transcript_74742:24-776(+)
MAGESKRQKTAPGGLSPSRCNKRLEGVVKPPRLQSPTVTGKSDAVLLSSLRPKIISHPRCSFHLLMRCWGCSWRGSLGLCPCGRSHSCGPLHTGVWSRRRNRTGTRSLSGHTSSSTPNTWSCPSVLPSRALPAGRRWQRNRPQPLHPLPHPLLPLPLSSSQSPVAPCVPCLLQPALSAASCSSTLNSSSQSSLSRRSRSRPRTARWRRLSLPSFRPWHRRTLWGQSWKLPSPGRALCLHQPLPPPACPRP